MTGLTQMDIPNYTYCQLSKVKFKEEHMIDMNTSNLLLSLPPLCADDRPVTDGKQSGSKVSGPWLGVSTIISSLKLQLISVCATLKNPTLDCMLYVDLSATAVESVICF